MPLAGLSGQGIDLLMESDKRYLVNSIRKVFDLPRGPARLITRTSENPFDKKY